MRFPFFRRRHQTLQALQRLAVAAESINYTLSVLTGLLAQQNGTLKHLLARQDGEIVDRLDQLLDRLNATEAKSQLQDCPLQTSDSVERAGD